MVTEDIDVTLTTEKVRLIVREEIERALMIMMDAKTTATAIEKGVYYSDVPLISHPKRKAKLKIFGRRDVRK